MSDVYTYCICVEDLKHELPCIDGSLITDCTIPISTLELEKFLREGASKINAALIARCIVPSKDMECNAHDAIAEAVKSYVASKVLRVLGRSGPLYSEVNDHWLEVYGEYTNRPQGLGLGGSSRCIVSKRKKNDDGCGGCGSKYSGTRHSVSKGDWFTSGDSW